MRSSPLPTQYILYARPVKSSTETTLAEDDDLLQFVEEVAVAFERMGLFRMAGRVVGWLLVCEPAHQSADELAAALQASRSSISMAMQLLQRSGAVERYPMPGSRRTYYRLTPGFWLREAEEKAAMAAKSAGRAPSSAPAINMAPKKTSDRLRASGSCDQKKPTHVAPATIANAMA